MTFGAVQPLELRDAVAQTSAPKPSPGRIVLYTLNDGDVWRINQQRMSPDGSIPTAVIGNSVRAGDVVPAIVVKVWPNGSINGQGILDGADSLWVMSASEGEGPGTWSWPPRV